MASHCNHVQVKKKKLVNTGQYIIISKASETISTSKKKLQFLRLIVNVLIQVLLEFGHVLWGVHTFMALQWLVKELLTCNGSHCDHHSSFFKAPNDICTFQKVSCVEGIPVALCLEARGIKVLAYHV